MVYFCIYFLKTFLVQIVDIMVQIAYNIIIKGKGDVKHDKQRIIYQSTQNDKGD